jgi:hypothetical protein
VIRFPLEITQSERAPQKRESWPNVIGKGLVILAVILFLVYFFFPSLDSQ